MWCCCGKLYKGKKYHLLIQDLKHLLSDDGTPFINVHVRAKCLQDRSCEFKSVLSSMEWSNKGINKTLLCILDRMVKRSLRNWMTLSLALQAYRISRHTSPLGKHFFLVYRAEVLVPIEVMVLYTQLALSNKSVDSHDHFTAWRSLWKGEKMQRIDLCLIREINKA